MDLVLIIGLIILGIFFMILEIFLIPGISVAGVASLICLVVGIVLAYTNLGPAVGTWILLGAVLTLAWSSIGSTVRKRLIACRSNRKSIPNRTFSGSGRATGRYGRDHFPPCSIGRVQINGKSIEGRSENEMIDQNTPVQVIEVGSYNVLVRKIQQ